MELRVLSRQKKNTEYNLSFASCAVTLQMVHVLLVLYRVRARLSPACLELLDVCSKLIEIN